MIDFAKMLAHSLENVAANTLVLSTPYDLPERLAKDLKHQNLIVSLVADDVDHALTDAQFGGWWVDRSKGKIFLRRAPGATLLIAGVDDRETVGANLLLECKLKGYHRITTTNFLGAVVEDLEIGSALQERLDKHVAGPRIGSVQYEAAFDDMFSLIGDAFRLDRRSFVQNRAAIVIGSLGPGGAERQASLSAIGLKSSSQYDPIVICNHLAAPGDFFLHQVTTAGVNVSEIEPAPPELQLPAVKHALAVLDERYPSLRMKDILHIVVLYAAALRASRPATAHLWMDYCSVLGGAAAYLVGVPRVIFGGRSVAPNRFNLFQPYMRAGYRSLLQRQSITLLNNSRAGADDYEAFLGLPSGQIKVLHNGFDFPEPDPAGRSSIRSALGIAANAKVVGSILRFSEEKRPRLLIDMAHSIHLQNPDVRFVFFGDGPLLPSETDYVRSLQMSDVIKLPGYADPAADALSALDLFVLASRMEGLPNVLIEAQAVGLPIVCTGVGGMNETFEHGITGFAVPGATPEELGAMVLKILTLEDMRETMSAAAKEHARSKFGIARMIEQTVDVYKQSVRAN